MVLGKGRQVGLGVGVGVDEGDGGGWLQERAKENKQRPPASIFQPEKSASLKHKLTSTFIGPGFCNAKLSFASSWVGVRVWEA